MSTLRAHYSSVEFMVLLMSKCPHQRLAQDFILQAVKQAAEQFAATPIAPNMIINPQQWQETAQWILREYENRRVL